MPRKAPTLKEKEADVTKAIRDLLDVCGIWHFKHWGGPMSPKGISDIIGCHKGRFFAIEVKAPGKIPGPSKPPPFDYKFFRNQRDLEQGFFLDNVNDAGGIGFFADSVEIVIEMLGLGDRVNGPLFEKANARK